MTIDGKTPSSFSAPAEPEFVRNARSSYGITGWRAGEYPFISARVDSKARTATQILTSHGRWFTTSTIVFTGTPIVLTRAERDMLYRLRNTYDARSGIIAPLREAVEAAVAMIREYRALAVPKKAPAPAKLAPAKVVTTVRIVQAMVVDDLSS